MKFEERGVYRFRLWRRRRDIELHAAEERVECLRCSCLFWSSDNSVGGCGCGIVISAEVVRYSNDLVVVYRVSLREGGREVKLFPSRRRDCLEGGEDRGGGG